MKLTELIEKLQEALKFNGDMNVVGIRNGLVFPDIELNCPDDDSPLYIELYNSEVDCNESSEWANKTTLWAGG